MDKWHYLQTHDSCVGPYNSDKAFTIEKNGQGFTFDTTRIDNRQTCAGIELLQCPFDIHALGSLQFTFKMEPCPKLWIAPLWFAPSPWVAPQCMSGEIDLLEACSTDALMTSFGDLQQGCTGKTSSLNVVSLRDNVNYDFKMDVETQKGSVNLVFSFKETSHSSWLLRGTRHNYNETHGWKEYNNSYTLRADVWNGGKGDEGYKWCGHKDSNSKCKYTVSNIIFTPKLAIHPVFMNQECASLFSPAPSPSHAPSPSPAPSPSHAHSPSPAPSPSPAKQSLLELWQANQIWVIVVGVLLFLLLVSIMT